MRQFPIYIKRITPKYRKTQHQQNSITQKAVSYYNVNASTSLEALCSMIPNTLFI